MKKTVIRRLTEEIVIDEDGLRSRRDRPVSPDPCAEDEIAIPVVVIPERFPRGYRKPKRTTVVLYRGANPALPQGMTRFPLLLAKPPRK